MMLRHGFLYHEAVDYEDGTSEYTIMCVCGHTRRAHAAEMYGQSGAYKRARNAFRRLHLDKLNRRPRRVVRVAS